MCSFLFPGSAGAHAPRCRVKGDFHSSFLLERECQCLLWLVIGEEIDHGQGHGDEHQPQESAFHLGQFCRRHFFKTYHSRSPFTEPPRQGRSPRTGGGEPCRRGAFKTKRVQQSCP